MLSIVGRDSCTSGRGKANLITEAVKRRGLRASIRLASTVVLATALSQPVHAQGTPDIIQTITSLVGVKPLPRNTSEYIPDTPAAKLAAQQLGKALFWDTQAGSDGNACATCHFHAGADIRVKNQVNPGLRSVPSDPVFDARTDAAGAGTAGPNQEYTAADFPLHQLTNVFNRMSGILYDTNDVFSSQGTLAGDFVSSARRHQPLFKLFAQGASTANADGKPGNEVCNLKYDPLVTAADGTTTGNPFHTNGLIHRKVEPRQTPTVINAVFNFRQFWDGRANSQFNGIDPFGARTYQPQSQVVNAAGDMEMVGNPHAAATGILVQTQVVAATTTTRTRPPLFSLFHRIAQPNPGTTTTQLKLIQPLIDNSSLASQAVGPPLSDFEMSCAGKSFADLGRKMISLRPLAQQRVHHEDSLFSQSPHLLGPAQQRGLNTSYKALIEKAFHPKYWSDQTKVVVHGSGAAGDPVTIAADAVHGYTQMEHNFSLFWGLAIQEYESLLISDDSPFDRGTMSPEAQNGKLLFETRGNCIACHHGPLMSGATVTSADPERPKVLENMLMNDGFPALYDNGYYNIGVRLPWDDLGVGAKDPYGFDLSYVRQYKWSRLGTTARAPDTFDPKPCLFQIPFGTACAEPPPGTSPQTAVRDAADGAFKVPILRNVGLNPPYFHNGGQSNLRDLVHFYKRGGDRRDIPGFDNFDTTWFGPTPFGVTNASNLHPDIGDRFNADDNTVNSALDLSDAELENIVQFLLALTDERVACHSGVFDHPELPLSVGQLEKPIKGTQIAQDIMVTLPAVGRRGLGAGNCFPNSGDLFDQADPLKVINQADPRGLQETFKKIVKMAK